MGLSTEERYKKALNGLRILRNRMEKYKQFLKTDDDEPSLERLDNWLKKLDYLTGLLIKKLDTNGTYWLLGPNSNNLESLYSDGYSLSYKGHGRKVSAEDFSAMYYLDEIDIVEFAKCLVKQTCPQAVKLAHWWNCQQAIGYIFYPVHRYDDDCFPEKFLEELTILSGQMALTRHPEDDNAEESHHIEQVVLTKYRVFRDMLDTYKPDHKFDSFSTKIDIRQFYDKVVEMTLPEVEEYLEEVERKEYKERYVEKEKKQVDGLVGRYPVRTLQELEDILDTSTNYEECKRADLERDKYYSTFGGFDWETRCKKAAVKTAAKKTKKKK